MIADSKKNSVKPKVAIISLDGATWDALLPWIRAGHLPNLARFVEEGSWGQLNSTMPPVTAPAWTSFQLGKAPGKHGLFHFTQRKLGSYDMPTINATNVPGDTIWKIASEAGLRVCTINVPVTYPPQPVNGYVVGGLLSPSPEKAFWPPELWDEVRQRVKDYEILGTISRFDYLGIFKFVDYMTEFMVKRGKLARYLLDKEDWDLFMIHFQDTDTLQHAAWAWIDPEHPDFASKSEAERDHVLGFYRELDRQIGQLIEKLGSHRNLILMSDHGFGTVTRRLYINQWLQNEGYLVALHRSSLKGRLIELLEKTVRRVDFLKIRRRLIKARGRMENMVNRMTGSSLIDWAGTRAYAPFGPIYAGIYLNTIGREPQGTVAPDQAWGELRDALRAKLLALVDPVTGRNVIQKIWYNEEVYQGARAELLPDLVLVPADGYQFATTFRGDTLLEDMPRFLSGTHRPKGIFALRGSAFLTGREMKASRIEDLAPTILYLLGLPVPKDMDGAVLTEALDPTLVQTRPITYAKSGQPAQTLAEQGLAVEESDAVKERLTDLGYLS